MVYPGSKIAPIRAIVSTPLHPPPARLKPKRAVSPKQSFGDDVLAPVSRRTGRLEMIVHHLGLALGGRPAASFAEWLMVPVSNDTLLRVVRRKRRRHPTR